MKKLYHQGQTYGAEAGGDVFGADPAAWEETVLYHPTSRAALEELLGWGFVDVHRQQHPEGGLFSWWDYRMLAFPKNNGLRLDYTRSKTSNFRSRISVVPGNAVGRRPGHHVPQELQLN